MIDDTNEETGESNEPTSEADLPVRAAAQTRPDEPMNHAPPPVEALPPMQAPGKRSRNFEETLDKGENPWRIKDTEDDKEDDTEDDKEENVNIFEEEPIKQRVKRRKTTAPGITITEMRDWDLLHNDEYEYVEEENDFRVKNKDIQKRNADEPRQEKEKQAEMQTDDDFKPDPEPEPEEEFNEEEEEKKLEEEKVKFKKEISRAKRIRKREIEKANKEF
jgi:hypothetical protein